MPSDADLVGAARRGSKEAMAELLHRHWNTAVLLAGRVLGSPDLARDAAQEAAIAAMTDLERLRSPDRFGAWFCGIALNVSRRWWRQLQDSRQRQHAMVLAERDGDRRLAIWIGSAEATVLALALESVETPRPFPYKLAAGLVEATGSRITEVKITRLLDSLFYAAVVVQGADGPREVDARPSDAVNLAVASGAPIWLNSELFSAALVHGDGKRPVSAPVATAGIAADAQQVMREGAQRRAQRSGPRSDGGGQLIPLKVTRGKRRRPGPPGMSDPRRRVELCAVPGETGIQGYRLPRDNERRPN
jgi:bifunctional DNase/RNase